LRIIFFNSWYADRARGSGTAAATSGLARGLESLGHRVETIPPRRRAPGLTARRLLYNFELAMKAPAGGAAPEEFDLAVGFDIDGFMFCRPPGRCYGVCLLGVSAEESRFERGWPRAYLGAIARLEGANARRADKTIVPSEHSRRAAIEAYGLSPEKVGVVPLGIDLSAWDASAASFPGRGEGRPTILSVARQYPRKNTKSLIAAMPAVRAEVPGALLRIVGGGPMLPALKKQAGELGLGGAEGAVEFLGELPSDEAVRREFFGADVFCLPSLQEGFGIVFLEAMAAGLPIVAARAAAIPEVAPAGEVARLVAGEDAGALADALIGLLKDAGERERLGAAGRARAGGFGWAESARRFVAEFEV
jgi:glycosyltransferase involved in cell wall biosynthesis